MALYANGKRVCPTRTITIYPVEVPRVVSNSGSYGSNGLETYKLPSGVTDIGDRALYY
jgi:hypothetical protein